MKKPTKHYYLVAFNCGATGSGNILRIQDSKQITALSLKELNEGIRQFLGPARKSSSFNISSISYLGEMTPEQFGDVNSWQQAAEPAARQRQC